MKSKYQGETLKYEVEALDELGQPADLSGCDLVVGMYQVGSIVKWKVPTVVANVITLKLSPADTATMLGVYNLKFMVRDTALDMEVIAEDDIEIKKNIIPNFDMI